MSLLSVQNLGKAFRSYRSEWQRVARWFGVSVKASEEHWVLHHVNFEIQPGEAIGIIGQNGAGKSTLLKMITGTMQPTEGLVHIKGRIAAILELGMGFNPELTGRQNVFHAAGLLGFSEEQIQQAMPEIEAFAEIGEYFDEPIRVYSSGMQMRVAFSVATAWRPEILIIDEALSVGDAYFQHKSFARIREFQELGTTLLIVSHDRSAIQSLCDRAVLLEGGTVIKDGSPEEVFDFYNAIIAEKENSTVEVRQLDDGRVQTSSGTGDAKVKDISLFNNKGEKIEFVGVGDFVDLRIKVKTYQFIETLVLGVGIKDRLGQVMFGTNTFLKKQTLNSVENNTEWVFNLSFPMNLGAGSYSIQTALCSSGDHIENNYEWQDLAHMFSVVNLDKDHFAGCVWLDPKITIEQV